MTDIDMTALTLCRCGHWILFHDWNGWCEDCKCTQPMLDEARYPLGMGPVTS